MIVALLYMRNTDGEGTYRRWHMPGSDAYKGTAHICIIARNRIGDFLRFVRYQDQNQRRNSLLTKKSPQVENISVGVNNK